MIWESLYDLVSGRYGMEAVSGPVGVTQAMSEAASTGIANMVYLAVVISMNLGVMNLLPLPALDGGRLVFLLVEGIRRKPVSRRVEGYIHFAGLAILMLFMVIVTFKDIIGLIR
jgi:regulator of sigma E protease